MSLGHGSASCTWSEEVSEMKLVRPHPRSFGAAKTSWLSAKVPHQAFISRKMMTLGRHLRRVSSALAETTWECKRAGLWCEGVGRAAADPLAPPPFRPSGEGSSFEWVPAILSEPQLSSELHPIRDSTGRRLPRLSWSSSAVHQRGAVAHELRVTSEIIPPAE
jgi:hypothetical protein